MLKLTSTLLLLLAALFSYSQGSWNIGYIPVDSLKEQHVGRIVRIDFKDINPGGQSSVGRHIRSLVGRRDTGTLYIDSTLITVVERRKIYADHGSYKDQFLECLSCEGFTLFIFDAEILAIDGQSILFRFETERREKNSLPPDRSSKIVGIQKTNLDGVMYQLL